MLAVLREALSNVERHASATAVTVGIQVTGGRLTLTVTDDGVGVEPARARGGLVNMRERAEKHGGQFEIRPARPHGTVIYWAIPLRD
jgi:signal transduction histidine kinase